MDPRYLAFFDLWNRQKFYECHEVLEEIWLDAEGDLREFYQGLIQAAAAFVHLEKRNLPPCRRLIQSALDKLEDLPPRFMGFQLREFVETLSTWQARIELMDILEYAALSPESMPRIAAPSNIGSPEPFTGPLRNPLA